MFESAVCGPWSASRPAAAIVAALIAGCSSSTGPVPTRSIAVTVGSKVVGHLGLAMSTSFQPATYDSWNFTSNPGGPSELAALNPQHVRLQSLSDGNPATTATTWDFSTLDAAAQPVLGVGDHSPEMQLGQGPSFMYSSSGSLLDTTGQQFAAYAANMVRYYNTGGFAAADGNHVSPSQNHVTWWGIYNEPNINNVSASQYVALYNNTVPAMLAVDPTIKLVAGEVTGDLWSVQNYLPLALGGLHTHVDAVAIHLYSTCGQATGDSILMSTVPTFAQSVLTARAVEANNPATAGAPIWITENNVDADYNLGNGVSACNGNTFTVDARGSSAFFAAWRPYVFSQVGKAGAQALYHWVFFGDAQYGEINVSSGAREIAYWVDHALVSSFPAQPGASILAVTSSDSTDVEVLAVQNPDSSAVVMIANHRVAHANDNNGRGAPLAIQVDLTALGSFRTATTTSIDASTDPSAGPTPVSGAATPTMTVRLAGYGVMFIALK